MAGTTETGINIAAEELLSKPGRSRQLLYAIITRAISDYSLMQQFRAAHLEYLHQLNESGHLLGAGPTLDGKACFYEGDGLIILKAESLGSATKIADADPFHQNRVREYEIKPWLLSEGVIMAYLEDLRSGH